MRLRISKSATGSTIATISAAVVLVAAAIWTQSSHHLSKFSAAATVTPTMSVPASSSSSPPTPAIEQPSVAGASTVAPTVPQKLSSSAPVATIPKAALSPSPLVTVVINGQKLEVSAANVSNACDVLKSAKAEGKISSLTIYESEKYMQSHGNSAYVYELNGIADQWQYSAADANNAPLSARGCSLTPVRPGYSVTWFTK